MKKRMLSLILAMSLLLALGLTVPAFAADYTEVVPCKYNMAGDFSEGLAAVAVQDGLFANMRGSYNYRWGFIDKTGKEVVPCKYLSLSYRERDQFPRFSEGLAAVIIDDGTEYNVSNYHGKVCFIDKTGKEVIPGKYDTASNFSEGLAMVGVRTGTGQGLNPYYQFACGFIDKTGKEVIPCQYAGAKDFSEGLAAVSVLSEEKGKYGNETYDWGYIDQTGKMVISPRRYKLVSNFSEGLAAVEDRNGKYGYIDKTGKEVIPCQYTAAGDFSEGLASVYVGDWMEGGKKIFIDKTGKMAIPTEYDDADNTAMYTFSEGLAAVEGYGFIDKTGKVVIPIPHGTAGDFSEGIAVIDGGWNHWGYIDKTGQEVVPRQYAQAGPVSEGMAAVAIRDGGSEWYYLRWGFITFDDVSAYVPEQPAEPEQPAVPEQPTVAVDSDFVIENGVLTKYVGPGGNIVIPSGATSIGSQAFERCWQLTGVTIPSGVTSIGDHAFSYCENLANVTIPSSVTSIGEYAFNYCGSLTDLTIPNSVTSIEGWAFAYCKSLTGLTIPSSVTSIGEGAFLQCNAMTSMTLPSSVTSISPWLFNYCYNMASVTIPSSVTNIGDCAFNSCDKLRDIYYGGTEEQWKAVQIDGGEYGAYLISRATIHYNSPMPQQPAEPEKPSFSDVKAGAFYAEPVAWAVEKGITAGTSTTTFSPDATCTQGQILTFLWRAQGEPAPSGSVNGSEFYAKAAQWAKDQGLTDAFSAEADCTRAMVVTYLWKLAGSPKTGTSNFSDVSANAACAQAVAWAVEKGITSGTSTTTFSPDATCTRGQIVTFLYRAFAD